MIRGERDDVGVATDERVDPIEQRPERSIELREHVLHFLAVRPERVSGQIEAREADGEQIAALVLAETQRLDERRGKPAQIRIRVRAALPLNVEVGVGCDARALEDVRKPSRPAARRRLPRNIVRRLIARLGQQARPRLAVVGVDRVRVDERFHLGNRRCRERRRGGPPIERGVQPRDGVAAVPGEHDRAAILQRERHDVRRELAPHFVREARHLEPIAAVAACGRLAVSDVSRGRIFGARHRLLAVAIPPRVLHYAVRLWPRAARDSGVSDARDRGEVRIGGVAKPRPARDEALQPAVPVRFEPIDVIGAHLIDHQQDDQFRRTRRGLLCLWDRREREGNPQEKQTAFHDVGG